MLASVYEVRGNGVLLNSLLPDVRRNSLVVTRRQSMTKMAFIYNVGDNVKHVVLLGVKAVLALNYMMPIDFNPDSLLEFAEENYPVDRCFDFSGTVVKLNAGIATLETRGGILGTGNYHANNELRVGDAATLKYLLTGYALLIKKV